MLIPVQPLDVKDLCRSYYYVQPKYDGIRATFRGGMPMTRSGKRFPNRALEFQMRSMYAHSPWSKLDLDGEVMLWNTFTKWWDPFDAVQSFVMSKAGGTRVTDEHALAWRFIIFDYDDGDRRSPFQARWTDIEALSCGHSYENRFLLAPIDYMEAYLVQGVASRYITMGYEGAIVRNPLGRYKRGRATYNEHTIFKYVDWVRDEAELIDVVELQHNMDTSTMRKDNLLPGGVAGALIVKHPEFGVFNIGSGFTSAQRADLWKRRASLKGSLVTFKYRPGHIKIAPCPAIYVGLRAKEDLS